MRPHTHIQECLADEPDKTNRERNFTCMCIYIYIYIYKYGERERHTHTHTYIHTYIHTCMTMTMAMTLQLCCLMIVGGARSPPTKSARGPIWGAGAAQQECNAGAEDCLTLPPGSKVTGKVWKKVWSKTSTNFWNLAAPVSPNRHF